MNTANICLFMGKYCVYADIYGECFIGQKNCNKNIPVLIEDDLEDYLDYDLFDEDL